MCSSVGKCGKIVEYVLVRAPWCDIYTTTHHRAAIRLRCYVELWRRPIRHLVMTVQWSNRFRLFDRNEYPDTVCVWVYVYVSVNNTSMIVRSEAIKPLRRAIVSDNLHLEILSFCAALYDHISDSGWWRRCYSSTPDTICSWVLYRKYPFITIPFLTVLNQNSLPVIWIPYKSLRNFAISIITLSDGNKEKCHKTLGFVICN